MLYDPKWETTKTKADPFSLANLTVWLERQDSARTYCYSNSGACLLHAYFTACGFKNVEMGGTFMKDDGGFHKLCTAFSGTASIEPHTFGAALDRARQFAA